MAKIIKKLIKSHSPQITEMVNIDIGNKLIGIVVALVISIQVDKRFEIVARQYVKAMERKSL